MNNVYVECLVKAKSSIIMKLLKVILILVTIATGLVGMMGFIFFLLIAIVAGVAAYFVFLNADVEYEYLYLDKEITVDKVMAQSKRKRMGVYQMDKMEIVAPTNSYHLDAYRNRTVQEIDYSGEGMKDFAIYYEGGKRIILSPSEEFVAALRNVAPRKVFLD